MLTSHPNYIIVQTPSVYVLFYVTLWRNMWSSVGPCREMNIAPITYINNFDVVVDLGVVTSSGEWKNGRRDKMYSQQHRSHCLMFSNQGT